MASAQAGDLLIEPGEFHFPIDPHDEVSINLNLTNLSSHSIAFNVKSNAPQRYISNPSRGIISSNNQTKISVTLLPQGPIDYANLKDKFLFQSVIMPMEASINDILPNTFDKSSANVIHTAKVSVFHAFKEKEIEKIEKKEEKEKEEEQQAYENTENNNSSSTSMDASLPLTSNLKNETLKSGDDSLKFDFETLKSDYDLLKKNLKTISEENVRKEEEKKIILDENESLKLQIRSLENEKKEKNEEINYLKDQFDEVKSGLENKTSLIEEMKKEKDDFDFQILKLENDVNEKEKEIQNLKTSMIEKETLLLEKDKTIDSLKSQNDVDIYKKENIVISNLKTELSSLKSQQKFLITQMEDLEQNKSNEIQKLRQKLSEAERTNKLNIASERNKIEEEKLNSLIEEIEDLKLKEEEKDEKLKELSSIIEFKENEIRKVHDQLAFLEMKVNYDRSDEDDQKNELLIKELNNLKLFEKEKDKMIDELNEKLKIKEKQIQAANDQITTLEVDLHLSESNFKEQEKRMNELQTEILNLNSKLKFKSKSDFDSSDNKKDMEQKLFILQKNLKNVLDESEASRTATEELRTMAEALNERCQNLHSVFDHLQIVDSRHPYHALKLRSEVEPAASFRGQRGSFMCSVCKKLGNGYLWHCSAPMCNYFVHISCPVTTVPLGSSSRFG